MHAPESLCTKCGYIGEGFPLKNPLEPAPDLPALLERCKPWLEDQRTVIAAIAENYEQKVILGKSYKEQLAELNILLADIKKAGVK